MKLARFWCRAQAEAPDPRGGRIKSVARGWSNESMDAARIRAREIAQRVAQRLVSHPGERNQYQYGDRPLPEPVIQQFGDEAAVTRNAYGALVLNADNLMFVDIDREASNSVLDGIRAISERHDLSSRVYRTAGGARAIVGNKSFQPGTSEAEALLEEFRSDRLYMHLCRMQQSFRARLTPKPWRCDFRKPPVDFPFETPGAEAAFRRWEAEYSAKSAPYATCQYLTTFGGVRIAPEFEDLIVYHDRETKANSNLALA